jgi:hypothetical protein
MDRQTALAMLEELRPRGGAGGIRTQAMTKSEGSAIDPRPRFGVGLTAGKAPDDFRIALRVQDEKLLGSAQLEAVIEKVNGEADVEYVGVLEPFAAKPPSPTPPTNRVRPLVPGCSISSTATVSAGTLGCFVEDQDGTYVLSNSHVVADFGAAAPGLAIVQPGKLDGGNDPADVIGGLARGVPVDPTALNVADAALVRVDENGIDPTVPGIGRPTSTPPDPDVGDRVAKRGRTTDVTTGSVRSINMNLKVLWPNDPVEFADLVEIESDHSGTDFAAAGDSGSLIVIAGDVAPLALLVAGGTANGRTLVYGTPMATVLRELAVSMV